MRAERVRRLEGRRDAEKRSPMDEWGKSRQGRRRATTMGEGGRKAREQTLSSEADMTFEAKCGKQESTPT